MTARRYAVLVLWWLCALSLIPVLVGITRGAFPVQTDLLDLLPKQRSPDVEESARTIARNFTGKVAVLLHGSDRRFEAAAAFDNELARTHLFEKITLPGPADLEASLPLLINHKEALIPDSLVKLFESGEPGRAALVERVTRLLASPLPLPGLSRFISRDPLLLIPAIISELPLPPSVEMQNGFPKFTDSLGRESAVLLYSVSSSVFDREAQQNATAAIRSVIREIESRYQDISIAELGALRIAEHVASGAERDARMVSIGSTVGTVLLLLFAFGSLLPVFFSFITVAFGVGAAAAITVLTFGSLHALTLGFGAALIGVCADYSIHFFCQRERVPGEAPGNVLKRVFPTIAFGAGTSIASYLGLLLTPFPGLSQMALFAVVGMLGTLFTISAWFPLLPHLKHRSRFFERYVFRERKPGHRPAALRILPILLLAGGGAGLVLTRSDDDVRSLQSVPSDQSAFGDFYRKFFASGGVGRFFLVTGATHDEVLERQSKLFQALQTHRDSAGIEGFQGIAQVVPPVAEQKRRLATVKQYISGHRAGLIADLSAIGFRRPDLEQSFNESLQAEPLTIPALAESPLGSLLKNAWYCTENGNCGGVVTVNGGEDRVMRSLEAPDDGVHFMNITGDATELLRRYRHTASALAALCYLGIAAVLSWRYGVKRGALGILPALLSLYLTLSVQGFIGIPVTLFTVLANIIVLGLAIDFAIFLLESRQEDERKAVITAVNLSAVTTLLSFGLLALSATPVLRSFGISLFIGTAVAMFSAPYLIPRHDE